MPAQPASGENEMRTATVHRRTRETDVRVTLNLDGRGEHRVMTGIGFWDHLLAQLAFHGLFDLEVQASGDLEVDPHHTVEDVALALGTALHEALGDRTGLTRIGWALVPMDEALAQAAVDLSGRPYAVIRVRWSGPAVGALPTSLIVHALESFAASARATFHIRILYGRDDHHKAEALFKALGRALHAATRPDERRAGIVPSTKGSLG